MVLIKSDDYGKLEWKNFRLYKKEFLSIVKIGVPAGLQSAMFSISNLFIASTINSFGSTVVEGNTVAQQVDGFIINSMNAITHTCLAFVSQNVGARKLDRVRKVVSYSAIITSVIALTMGVLSVLFQRPICGIITNNQDAIKIAGKRMLILGLPYFIYGIMDVYASAIRGLGKSTLAMVLTLLCCCVFRIIWIYTIYPLSPTLTNLYLVYPVSYVMGVVLQMCFYFPLQRRAEQKLKVKLPEKEELSK